jgi:hypothetical protein
LGSLTLFIPMKLKYEPLGHTSKIMSGMQKYVSSEDGSGGRTEGPMVQ